MSFIEPEVIISLKTYDTANVISPTGTTWDYQNILEKGTDEKHFRFPSKSEVQESFPSAEIKTLDSSNKIYVYYKKTTDSLIELGNYEYNTQDKYIYSNPCTKMIYPFTSGDIFYDTFEGESLHEPDQHSGGPTYRRGTITVQALNNGTLLLPNTSYNCLLIKTIIETRDSTVLYPGSLDIVIIKDDTTTIYDWYVEDFGHPVFQIVFKKVKNGNNSFTDKKVAEFTPIITSTNETTYNTGYKIYPNPTHKWINIEGMESKDFIVNVYSVSGKLLQSFDKKLSLDLSDYPPGYYSLEIISDKKTSYLRFMKL